MAPLGPNPSQDPMSSVPSSDSKTLIPARVGLKKADQI